MVTATMTSKGQITIPLPVRIALGLEAGSQVEFVECETGEYRIIPVTDSVHSLKGMFQSPHPVSVEAMNAVIAAKGSSAK